MNPSDIIDIVGPDIGVDLTTQQRDRVADAIHENPDGVARVANHVLGNPKVRKPVAVFLAELDKGKHLLEPSAAKKHAAQLTILEWAERMYRARYDTYPHLGADDAIEYAVDYTNLDKGNQAGWDVIDLEHALRERIGHPWTYDQTPPRYLSEEEQAKRRAQARALLDHLHKNPLFPSMP